MIELVALVALCLIAFASLTAAIWLHVQAAGAYQRGLRAGHSASEAYAALARDQRQEADLRSERLLDRIHALSQGGSLLGMKQAQQVRPNDMAKHEEEMAKIERLPFDVELPAEPDMQNQPIGGGTIL